jgi:uncharacterized protein
VTAHSTRRLDLFVTERCNLACEYCFAASQPYPDLPEERLLDAVDWLMSSRAERVHLTLWGGEPLLRLDGLRRVVRHARRAAEEHGKTLTLSLPTNASLIRDETMVWLGETGIEIFLSIDGDEAGQRARPLRAGGSSHRLVAAGMRRALGGPQAAPAIRMTLSPHDAHRLRTNVQYFVDQGARKLLIYAATDQPWSEAQIAGHRRGQLALADWLVERVAAGSPVDSLPTLTAWRPILRRLFDEPKPRRREGPLQHCGVGGELVAFGVDQRLWPCHRFLFYGRDRGADLTLGSIAEGIDEAKAAPYAALRIEQIRGVTRCVDCDLFDLCTQGCLAINYAGTGRLSDAPPAACALMEAQIEACRRVHEALRDDPAYAQYLGRSVRRTLRHAAAKLGDEAYLEYDRGCAVQPDGDEGAGR